MIPIQAAYESTVKYRHEMEKELPKIGCLTKSIQSDIWLRDQLRNFSLSALIVQFCEAGDRDRVAC